MSDERKPLSLREAADYLGVSRDTLDRLRFQHGLPYSQPGGHRTKVWFHPDAIDEWVRNNEKTGAA